MEALQNAGSAIQMRWCRFYFNGKQTQWDFLLPIWKKKKALLNYSRCIILTVHVLLSFLSIIVAVIKLHLRETTIELIAAGAKTFPSTFQYCAVCCVTCFIGWIVSSCTSIILCSWAELWSGICAGANLHTKLFIGHLCTKFTHPWVWIQCDCNFKPWAFCAVLYCCCCCCFLTGRKQTNKKPIMWIAHQRAAW